MPAAFAQRVRARGPDDDPVPIGEPDDGEYDDDPDDEDEGDEDDDPLVAVVMPALGRNGRSVL